MVLRDLARNIFFSIRNPFPQWGRR